MARCIRTHESPFNMMASRWAIVAQKLFPVARAGNFFGAAGGTELSKALSRCTAMTSLDIGGESPCAECGWRESCACAFVCVRVHVCVCFCVSDALHACECGFVWGKLCLHCIIFFGFILLFNMRSSSSFAAFRTYSGARAGNFICDAGGTELSKALHQCAAMTSLNVSSAFPCAERSCRERGRCPRAPARPCCAAYFENTLSSNPGYLIWSCVCNISMCCFSAEHATHGVYLGARADNRIGDAGGTELAKAVFRCSMLTSLDIGRELSCDDCSLWGGPHVMCHRRAVCLCVYVCVCARACVLFMPLPSASARGWY